MRILPVLATAGLVLSLTGCGVTREPPRPLRAAAPTVPPSTAPSVAPMPQTATKHYRGSGSKLIRIEPTSEIGLITIVAHGRGSFLVQSVDVSGDDVDFLAEGVGDHRGTRIFNLDEGEAIAGLRVTAQGSWKITLKPLAAARTWSGLVAEGFGDDVLYLDPEPEESEKITSAFTGDDNFTVEGYGDDGSGLLANEIGPCEVEGTLLNGMVLVTVEGNGPWTLRRTGPSRRLTAAGLRLYAVRPRNS